MGVHPVTPELSHDPVSGVTRPGVDEDVLDEVGVDGVGEREGVEVPDAVGELLHGRAA
jgi:hypothetical protein